MRIGLIAGGGQFPLLFCKKAKQAGYAVFAAAYVNEADDALNRLADAVEWMHLGQLNRLIRFFKKNGVESAVMLGAITKRRLFRDVRPDMKAISLVSGLRHTHDDGLLRVFADFLQKNGIAVQPSTFLLPDLLARSGRWTRARWPRSAKADARFGWSIAKEIGRLDIGQCVVVEGGTVLAVEAIDGTDAAIARGGRLGSGEAVVIKVCKPIQDERFDVPAVGRQTIETMQQSGVRWLLLEAGRAVVFDRPEMIALADKQGIGITALDTAGLAGF